MAGGCDVQTGLITMRNEKTSPEVVLTSIICRVAAICSDSVNILRQRNLHTSGNALRAAAGEGCHLGGRV